MATIVQVQAKLAGTVLTSTAATAGPDKVKPGDGGAPVYVLVDNAGASPVTVTVADPGKTKYGQANPSIPSVSVPAGGKAVLGPIQPDLKQSDGNVNLTASSTTSVSFYAFRG
ncbi:hypothetical protein [Amycolatopsis rubida]|uniref:Uncharacterized protein n=1 Tax=Amycolatopsis rubida TaxID=112413 RepID=A0A1I5IHD7_9PSEU|nr:hypothetical protein [Amycolatopsis rubida]SFO59706.1 hypothetical protein SAMN05421854_102461 [Amycolatopsis rubida]